MQSDIIGLIPSTPATYDDEGNELTPGVYKDGWHVNTLVPVPEWEEYRCAPEQFFRVYAGNVSPVCYRFPNEEFFKSLLPQEEE